MRIRTPDLARLEVGSWDSGEANEVSPTSLV